MPGYPRPRRANPVSLDVLVGLAGPAAHLDDAGTGETAGLTVTGVTHDSAAVGPGDLYAALPGTHRHGAQFAAGAVMSGARAILTDPAGSGVIEQMDVAVPVVVVDDVRAVLGPIAARVYGDPTERLQVIGITGTAGKTTSAYLVESGLLAAGMVSCLVGTVESRIAGEAIHSTRTTPEATDLQAMFAAAVERGATAAVIEVSSHALSYGRVGGVRFAVGAFTNFGLDHLDFHADVSEYFAAKASLFDGRCAVELLNRDDPAVRALLRPGGQSFSASGDPAATWRAERISRDGFTQRFTAVGPGLVVPGAVALPGRHNVANALLAIASLVAVGVEPVVAANGVAACRGVPGRLELVDAAGPVLGVVDYAHKPDAIVAALSALREVAQGRLVCVIGAGGDRDRGKRAPMGEAAAKGADLVVVTDDNPRSEDPDRIRAEVLAGARAVASGQVLEVAGRRVAIAIAVGRAEPGDVVALLGKGHEVGQEVEGVTLPFDDRTELAAALAKRFGPGQRGSGQRGSGQT